jgi:hypothetical protein
MALKPRRSQIAIALASAVLLGTASTVVGADPSASPGAARIGMGMSASRLILGADQRTGSFTVFNAGDVDETFVFTVTDLASDSSGKLVPTTAAVALGAASWVSIEPTKVTLVPQQSIRVVFTLVPPADAAPGDHYTSVVVRASMSDAVWAKRVETAGGSAIVRSAIAQDATIVVRIPGTIVNNLAADLSAIPSIAMIWDSTGYTFQPKIVNGGNVAAVWIPATDTPATADPVLLVPTLRLTSRIPLFGGDQLLYPQNKDKTPGPVVVLPGTTTTQKLTLADVPIIGDYDLTYTLPGNDADGRATVTATAHITLINMQKVFLFIVLPLLVLILLLLLRTWRKRQDRKYRSRVKEEAMREARAALEREAVEARATGPQGPTGGGPRSGTIR